MRHRELQSLLIGAGLVSGDVMRRAVTASAGTETSWLEYLIARQLVGEDQVAACAARRHVLPLCELERIAEIPAETVALVPWDLAIEHRIVPLAVEPDGDLRIAMLDPCDADAATELEFFLGRRLLREVAPATPIAWALHRYYSYRSPLWPQAQRASSVRSKPILRPIHALQAAS